MKGLLISYGDYEYDGRLRSLASVFSEVCELDLITRYTGKNSYNHHFVYNVPYWKFIIKCVHLFHKEQYELLILDNRKATVPGLIIKTFYNPRMVIQDCRELYILSETKHIVGKIGCIFERLMARRVDLVICANQERAELTKKEFALQTIPLVFENIRMLEYESEEALLAASRLIDPLLSEDEYRIVSTSGCSIDRTNDVLVKNLNKVNYKCHLYLVGNSNEYDKTVIETLSKKLDCNHRVTIIDQLNQSELKYLIEHAHIGVVNYGQYDTNNMYCASGKLFEFIYENVPVITTSNPPLVRFCNETGLGKVDDDYYQGINKLLDNLDIFKKNIADYCDLHPIEMETQSFLCILKSGIR